ncbi:hypothetical protein P153DRAFT_395841 [Dothidotthia symphoricarpi CBS 119687]|uniref:Uncharacterized protein n=1 Tax=Dothidotthia symphoricarpi CBS 119687 TaxID=1392245 RepID=A0A6A6AHP8_9PLEO|nr:uncharacterized protein P153DRAFT_395841 [Dothidotthia symphoricarpi CBS 119687]KAF2130427.1 hypothetical protein P153DRAFT_395841 [Dothidotthia symphoricarpi CBS 119687]
MRLSTLLPTLALALPSTAYPFAILHNLCPFPIYLTSSGVPAPPTLLPPLAYHLEEQYFSGTGTAIKITQTPDGLYTGAPTLHFSYTYTAGVSVYYDLSSHGGFDFEGWTLVLGGGKEDVVEVVWEGEEEEQRTEVYWGETDLVLTLCQE